MSAIFKTQGGSGGFFPSIFVTGLSETDTVYASKDGRTVQGKWVANEAEVFAEIPVMTSDTSPSGTCSAIYTASSLREPAWRAFDGDTHTSCYIGGLSAYPAYLIYDFGNEQIKPSSFYGYAEHAWDGAGQGTGSWTVQLQGSNDGVVWDNLSNEVVWNDRGLCWYKSTSTEDVNIVTAVDTDKYYSKFRLAILSSTCTNNIYANYPRIYTFQVEGTKTRVLSGHLISPLREFGTWTVTATDGTQTATREILVDVATEYDLKMFYGIYTDFSAKEADWTEEGGTFNYGDGLYVTDAATKPIIASGDLRFQYLTIPFSANTFDIEFSTIVSSAYSNAWGGVEVYLKTADNSTVVRYQRFGDDAANTQQLQFIVNGGVVFSQTGLSWNGVSVEEKIAFDGSTIKYFENGVEKYSGAVSLGEIAKIQIGFWAHKNTSYVMPAMKVEYLAAAKEG